jgi:hypothetical protein
MRYLLPSMSVLALFFYSNASAMDLWSFNGRCKEGVVKQGSPYVDMHNIRGSPIYCDAATLMELDNGRKVMQFVQKSGTLMPPGFAGGEFKDTEGHYSLIVDRVYPQRSIVAGKSIDQLRRDAEKTAIPADGYCFFSDRDFSKLTEFSCVTKTENVDTKIIYTVVFDVADISIKRNMPGLGQNKSETNQPQNAANQSFSRIFEYTIFDQTLPDGKHPVWVYYQSGEKIVRVDMPSLDMCVVTPESAADWGVIKSTNYDVIPKASKGWDFALEIWKAAFQRHLVVGQPKAC